MASTNRANVLQATKQIGIVENVATFRRLQTPNEICILPEIFQKRKSTDVAFLIAFVICVVVLLSTMIYTLVNSDIQRLIHGYDDCGNVCGFKNALLEGIPCAGQDMSDKPYLTYSYGRNGREISCSQNCSYRVKFHRCDSWGDEFFPEIVGEIEEESVGLTVLCLVGLGLSILALIVFRYFVREFVWFMLILSILLMFALTGFLWWLYSETAGDTSGVLYSAIIVTILSLVFALCILFLKERINLMIAFFKEAAKTVFAMPLILIEPVLTFISNFLVLAIFLYTFILMSSAGTLEKVSDYYYGRKYDYIPDGAMIFALCWGVIMMIWMVQFVLACQQMVISGAVASYYFARDKLSVVSPVYNSFYNLVRYHLGTVAFGSLILTVVTILKYLLNAAARENGGARLIYYCCFRPIERLVKYMTSMGYIETAIHGQPLCPSSMRAINLIVANLLSAVALNSIGNLVFFMTKLSVVVVTVGIGIGMKLPVSIVVFGGVVALLCIHCFFVVFEIAVDTIFLCYCEDQCVNDGATNAYYTTVDLYNEIQKAQALTVILEQKKKKK